MPSATVRALATTPVKALRLQTRESVRLERQGAVENRRFYVLDERGRMINGKQLGTLSAVVADYDHDRGTLALTFPGGETVAGPVETGERVDTRFFSRQKPALDVEGPWSAALSAHTGRELRLVMATPESTAIDRGRRGAVSLISAASIERLSRVAAEPVDPRRFRMLIEVDGLDAHAEDAWVGQTLRIGAARVRFHGHVGRCLITGQHPDTGVADLPTLDLLRTYRDGLGTTEPLAFGIYGEVLEAGEVHVGDPVRAAD